MSLACIPAPLLAQSLSGLACSDGGMGGSAIHALLRALANETWQALTHMTCFWEVDMSGQRRVPRFRKMGVCLAGMGATPGATPQKEKVAVSAASPPSVDFSTEQVLACVQLVAQSVMVSISTIATGSFAFAFAEQRPREAETEVSCGEVECKDCAAVPGRLTLLCRLL